MGSQPNRLIHETSPYLLQHAHNPVDWYPWGPEALERARRENKPIVLSIGYSACHWCHVMEHESFEDDETAALMNEHFVSIKVDREERPDLDQIYQTAAQMFLGRGGGWPLTMFLTPDGRPFFAGTYFPPVDRYQLPGFKRVLEGLAQAYRDKSKEVAHNAEQIVAGLAQLSSHRASDKLLQPKTIDEAVTSLSRLFDPVYGGIGQAPKFPSTMVLSLMLRHAARTGEASVADPAVQTLRKMAEGGIYDQLGGGFHRYSVDAKWLVPHFEKMLYDNAQLLKAVVDVYRVTGDPLFERVARETAEYVLREMARPEGGFYSTQDADSEGEEGKFFVWTVQEVEALLGASDAKVFCNYYDVTAAGNFEGKNILHVDRPVKAVAKVLDRSEDEVRRILEDGRKTLFAVREKRIKPARDEKILTSWNGLMLTGMAEAYNVLGESRYLEAAQKTASFIRRDLTREGLLLATFKDGTAKLNAYLDDYAFLIQGLLDVYEADADPSWLSWSVELCETMIEQFWDDDAGGFFFTGRDHETLINRPKAGSDHSIPAGNAVAAMDLLRLFWMTEREDYLKKAEQTIRLFYDPMIENPYGYATFLAAFAFYLDKPREVVIVGDRGASETRSLLSRIHGLYQPNKVLMVADPASGDGRWIPSPIRGKTQKDGRPTVYVCRDFTCSPPAVEWEDIKKLILT